jgi:hypothetical protein
MEVFIVGRKSFLSGKLLLALFAAGSMSSAFATPGFPACPTDSLANYITNTFSPPGGCAIGILDYFDFTYHPLSNAPLASAIQVTPFGTGFSIGPVSAAPGVTVQFEIDYDIVIDPAPIITGGDLGLDPPRGNIVVTERFCNDTSYTFASGTCLGGVAPEILTVGTAGTGFPISARINFVHPATVSQQVAIVFTLTGGANGAFFDDLNAASIVNIPEPAAAAGLLLGLLTLGGGYKLRKQRAH